MSKRRDKGFTLAETMVVLLLLGIVVSVAQLNVFALLGRSRFKASVQDLVDVFRMAIKASAESDHRYQIEINLNEQTYALSEITHVDDYGDIQVKETLLEAQLPLECYIEQVIYDDGRSYGQGDVVYFWIGHAGWFRGAAIYLSDKDGNQYSILINRLNRMVELLDGEIEMLGRKDDIDMTF